MFKSQIESKAVEEIKLTNKIWVDYAQDNKHFEKKVIFKKISDVRAKMLGGNRVRVMTPTRGKARTQIDPINMKFGLNIQNRTRSKNSHTGSRSNS